MLGTLGPCARVHQCVKHFCHLLHLSLLLLQEQLLLLLLILLLLLLLQDPCHYVLHGSCRRGRLRWWSISGCYCLRPGVPSIWVSGRKCCVEISIWIPQRSVWVLLAIIRHDDTRRCDPVGAVSDETSLLHWCSVDIMFLNPDHNLDTPSPGVK